MSLDEELRKIEEDSARISLTRWLWKVVEGIVKLAKKRKRDEQTKDRS